MLEPAPPVEWRRDPVLSHVHEYWKSKRAGRNMPARRDIDPIEIGIPAICHLVLTEPVMVDGVLRYRFRLAGGVINEAAGREMTNQFIHLVNPDAQYAAYLTGLCERVIETCRPLLSSSTAMGARTQHYLRTIRLMHPLSSDGVTVDMILTAQVFRRFGTGAALSYTAAASYEPGETVVIDPDAPAP